MELRSISWNLQGPQSGANPGNKGLIAEDSSRPVVADKESPAPKGE